MNLLKNSFFFCLLMSLYDRVCEKASHSILGLICHKIAELFRKSLICGLLSLRSRLSEKMKDSRVIKILEGIINIIPTAFMKLGKRFPRFSEGSLALSLADFLAENLYVIYGLILMLFLCIPYERWNNAYSLIAVVLMMIIYWAGGIKNEKHRLSLKKLGFWPVFYAMLTGLSYLWSKNPDASRSFLLYALTCMLAVLLFVSAVNTEDKLYSVCVFIAMGLIGCSLYAVYQRITGVEASSSFTDLSLNANMPGRVFSFFHNPNSFANLLVFSLPLMFALIFYGKTGLTRLIFLGAFILGALALLMTYSRGGWFALACAGVILALMLCPRWVPLFLVLAVCTVPFWPENIRARLLTVFSSDSSINSRSFIYTANARLIKHMPLFGAGLGYSSMKLEILGHGWYNGYFPYVHAHNIFMEICGESGIFTLLAFLLAMFFPIRDGALRIKKDRNTTGAVAAGASAGLIGSLIYGMTDYPWAYPRVMLFFWIIFAILVSANNIKKSGKALGK
ncbi:MAG: O-antigen ligase family protein [Oscillospiraceae bacterium]|nr:O-antigen ligase family protein [Oscillospiraceae bacterium]